MVQKIALEEHFLSPGYEEYWRPTVGNVDPNFARTILSRLTDFGEMRLKSMDEAGIARSVLAIAGPGVQSERDVRDRDRAARESPTISWRVKSRSGPTAIRALPTSPFRTRAAPPTNWSAACAS